MIGRHFLLGLQVLRMLLEAAQQPAIVAQGYASTLEDLEVSIPSLRSMIEPIGLRLRVKLTPGMANVSCSNVASALRLR